MVLIDLDERKVTGEVLDLQNGAVFLSGVKIRGGTEYSLMHGSDIVIVTAGARKIAGESMENLINKNVQNMRTIMCAISRMAPNSDSGSIVLRFYWNTFKWNMDKSSRTLTRYFVFH